MSLNKQHGVSRAATRRHERRAFKRMLADVNTKQQYRQVVEQLQETPGVTILSKDEEE